MEPHRPRSQVGRLLDWMEAWDHAVNGLLLERPPVEPAGLQRVSAAGIALAAAMLVALVAVVARLGPDPFLLVMFLAFATLYVAVVPLPLLLRPLGARAWKQDADDLREAAARSHEEWAVIASRAVAAWYLARDAALRQLDPLVLSDSEARATAERIRALIPPPAPIPGADPGALREAASTPLTPIPSLEGWGAVAGGVVYLARRKPFNFGEVAVVVVGACTVPPAIFFAIDGIANVVTCALVPADACEHPEAGRKLFILAMIALTGVVILWRVVSQARVTCPACGTPARVHRLAPTGKCQGCGRRLWVAWRK